MTTDATLARARTLLFVPGNRPERFAKAANSGADAIVLDLEDSVPIGEKPVARQAILEAWAGLTGSPVPVVVRINAADTDVGRADLEWLPNLARLAGIMLPKAESAQVLESVGRSMAGIPLLPLIETAVGLSVLREISSVPGVLRLVVGHIDFVADTGIQCSDDERELAPLRFEVAMATRVNRLAAAVDGVTTAIDDEELLQGDTRRALRFGFGGKLCIHPRQIAAVHAAMAPAQSEVEWARRVLEADANAGGAATQLDGRMVDLPVVMQARRIVARVR